MKTMTSLLYPTVVGTALMLILPLIAFSLYSSNRQKGSPFECGFQPFNSVGVSFSMPFFVVSLIFLLFDVEILLVSCFPLIPGSSNLWGATTVIMVCIFVATLYEWKKGILKWV